MTKFIDDSQKEMAEKAKAFFGKIAKQFQEDESHPYLNNKGIRPTLTMRHASADAIRDYFNWNSFTFQGDVLVIPKQCERRIVSLQFIDENGDKRNLYKALSKGAYWCSKVLPERSSSQEILVIGEGVATVQSVVQHDGDNAVGVAAFSCGNLVPTAQELKQRFPNAIFVVLGDRENGSEDAIEAASVLGTIANFPPFSDEEILKFQKQNGKNPSDWNDYILLKIKGDEENEDIKLDFITLTK